MNTYEIFTTQYSVIVQADSIDSALIKLSVANPDHSKIIAIIDAKYSNQFLNPQKNKK